MTTVEYLDQIFKLDSLINNKIAEVSHAKEIAYSLMAIRYDKECVQTSPNFDKIGTALAKIDEMNRKIALLIDNYLEKKEKIISQIETLPECYYNILFKRYAENKTFARIANEMNYSERQIQRKQDDALELFEKKYGNEYLGK